MAAEPLKSRMRSHAGSDGRRLPGTADEWADRRHDARDRIPARAGPKKA
jgi:hypothetical protein